MAKFKKAELLSQIVDLWEARYEMKVPTEQRFMRAALLGTIAEKMSAKMMLAWIEVLQTLLKSTMDRLGWNDE